MRRGAQAGHGHGVDLRRKRRQIGASIFSRPVERLSRRFDPGSRKVRAFRDWFVGEIDWPRE